MDTYWLSAEIFFPLANTCCVLQNDYLQRFCSQDTIQLVISVISFSYQFEALGTTFPLLPSFRLRLLPSSARLATAGLEPWQRMFL